MTMLGTGIGPFFAVVLMWISCAVLGRWLFRTQWILAFLGGLCVWALAIAFLADMQAHYRWVYIAVHVVILTAPP